MDKIQQDEKKVLFIASFTEFGERYSYYIIQALLIFFLVDRFHISQSNSAVMVGTALSMVYIAAIIGGFISDRLIGYYPAAFLGSLIMIFGSYILSISNTENILCIGLTFISISTGLIKSNISSFIGKYYDKSGLSNSHRDFGFSIFYIGINLGNFLALFLATYLKNKYNYAVPFYSCIIITIIMALNTFSGFFILRKYIDTKAVTFKNLFLTLIILICYSLVIFTILKQPVIANASIFLAIALCMFILYKSAQKSSFNQVAVAFIFFSLSILYWSLYFQQYISILLFIDKTVNHKFFNFNIDSSQFLAFTSISIVLLGSLTGKIWLYFGKKGRPVSDIDKFNIGFILMSIFFVILFCACKYSIMSNKVPAISVITSMVILAVSELCLSAIGLSMITKIAPSGFVSLYMAIWLVTLGIGGKIAGYLSSGITISENVYASKLNMMSGLSLSMTLAALGIAICLLTRKKIIKQINH